MRVVTSLSPVEAHAAMLTALEAEGVEVTHRGPPLIQGHIVETRRGNIKTRTLSVTVDAAEAGSVVTVNGQAWAYTAGRRAARTLP